MKRQDGGDPLAIEGVATGVPVPVTVSSITGTSDVNIAKVGGNAVSTTVPVSGTVTVQQSTATNLKAQAEAYQGGSAVGAANPLQVSLANTGANGTAVKVDGTGGAFPVSGTVTVQQATASNLKAQVTGAGSAGTADTGVVTVQGIASATPLLTSSGFQTGVVYAGVTALTPKFAAISVSASGDNTLVAAVTNKKIRVLQVWLMANGTVNAKFQSGASGTDLTGLAYMIANTGVSMSFTPTGLFETASGVLLNLNLSAAVAIGGSLVYVEV